MTRWSDHRGDPVDAPEPPPQGSYYGPIGDWQGAEYERNAFTTGTAQEITFLRTALGLDESTLVVDIGCGTGRHARALAAHGVRVVGLDLSAGLLHAAASLARRPSSLKQRSGSDFGAWVQGDARRLPLRDGCADVVWSLCQGGFGITPGGDEQVLGEMVRILRPGGRLALTAFSLVFAARWLVEGDAFDVERGLQYSAADVRGPDGQTRRFDLWTQCYSAGHLRCLAERVGLTVDAIHGVEPGDYGHAPPGLRHPELLLLATKR